MGPLHARATPKRPAAVLLPVSNAPRARYTGFALGAPMRCSSPSALSTRALGPQSVVSTAEAIASTGSLSRRHRSLRGDAAAAPSPGSAAYDHSNARAAARTPRRSTPPWPSGDRASSGMAEGGRVVHHLLHRRRPAQGSFRRLSGRRHPRPRAGRRRDTVGIHGHRLPVRAAVHLLSSLSAHADCEELVRWARALPAPPQRVFLNHGEDAARKALAAALAEIGWPAPALPISGDQAPW